MSLRHHTAMVLAAGLGTRMRPLTLATPKPLLRVAGRTMLDHVLDRLDAAGVETAVVNVHWLAEQIVRHLADRTRPRVVLVHEDRLLETGGSIRNALDRLGPDPIFTCNSDTLWLDGPSPALERMMQAWDPEQMDGLLLLMASAKAFGYEGSSDYHLDPLGRAVRRQPGEMAPFVFAGVTIVKPEAYRDAPEGPFSSVAVWDRMQAEGRLFGIVHDGAWFHIGAPDALDLANGLIEGRLTPWLGPWP